MIKRALWFIAAVIVILLLLQWIANNGLPWASAVTP